MKSKALRCAHSSGFPYSGKGLTMIFPGVKINLNAPIWLTVDMRNFVMRTPAPGAYKKSAVRHL